MSTTNKPNWLPTALKILAAVILIALIWIIFDKCGTDNKHKDEKKDVNEKLEEENVKEKALFHWIEVQKKENDSLKRVKSLVEQENEILRKQLAKSGNTILRLGYEVQMSKILKDTVNYVSNCDSLVDESKNIVALNNQYVEVIEHQTEIHERELKNRDSLTTRLLFAFTDSQLTIDTLGMRYNGLYTDYNKLIKKEKRKSILLKGTAILAGAFIVQNGFKLLLKK